MTLVDLGVILQTNKLTSYHKYMQLVAKWSNDQHFVAGLLLLTKSNVKNGLISIKIK